MNQSSVPAARREPAIGVIIATKGRPRETAVLLGALQAQSRPADIIVVVGTCSDDILDYQPTQEITNGTVKLIAPSSGLPLQRNFGLDWLSAHGFFENAEGFVAFFDDDFRPHKEWLNGCRETFLSDPKIVGVTGVVIADGIIGPGLSETDADEFILGTRVAMRHWTDRPHLSPIDGAYGCNMAFRASVAEQVRFDDSLPLYAWQEDTDYTGRTRKFGLTVTSRLCKGVHLGVKSGRTSGIRLGYSQIANPLHIAQAGNMRWTRASALLLRALASNSIKSVVVRSLIDYPGRLRGNFLALTDLFIGRCKPNRILEL